MYWFLKFRIDILFDHFMSLKGKNDRKPVSPMRFFTLLSQPTDCETRATEIHNIVSQITIPINMIALKWKHNNFPPESYFCTI